MKKSVSLAINWIIILIIALILGVMIILFIIPKFTQGKDVLKSIMDILSTVT